MQSDPVSTVISSLTDAPLAVAALVCIVIVIVGGMSLLKFILTKWSENTASTIRNSEATRELSDSVKSTINASRALHESLTSQLKDQGSHLEALTKKVEHLETSITMLSQRQDVLVGVVNRPPVFDPSFVQQLALALKQVQVL